MGRFDAMIEQIISENGSSDEKILKLQNLQNLDQNDNEEKRKNIKHYCLRIGLTIIAIIFCLRIVFNISPEEIDRRTLWKDIWDQIIGRYLNNK